LEKLNNKFSRWFSNGIKIIRYEYESKCKQIRND
jgi:hypothetical protein